MADPETVAKNLCLRALTGTPKTRQQLADLLADRDVPDDAAEAVLDRLSEVGLIDDEAFAQAWVTSRQAGRGLARRALKAELRAKGVDDEVAATAVEAVDDDDERETARRLVDRKIPGMRRLDRATATRRLMGMLARKGYSGDWPPVWCARRWTPTARTTSRSPSSTTSTRTPCCPEPTSTQRGPGPTWFRASAVGLRLSRPPQACTRRRSSQVGSGSFGPWRGPALPPISLTPP